MMMRTMMIMRTMMMMRTMMNDPCGARGEEEIAKKKQRETHCGQPLLFSL